MAGPGLPGRHLRGRGLGLWRRPATMLWAAMTTLCATALVLTLLVAPADKARRAAVSAGPSAAQRSPVVVDTSAPAVPPSTETTGPTARTEPPPALLTASPAVNRIEDYSDYPDGIQVQIEEAEWWKAPGSRHLELVKALVRIGNHGRRPFGTGQAAVTLRYGKSRAAADLVEKGHYAGPVQPGTERFAQWLFVLPEGNHDDLEITVAPAADRRPAVFTGHADLP